MLPNERKKQTLGILAKMRQQGAPGAPVSPFPGETDPALQGQDLSPMGDVTSGVDPELSGLSAPKPKRRIVRPARPASPGSEY